MSIQSEINRIKNNVDLSLEAVASKGVTVPADANSDNLPQLIEAISTAPDPTTVWEIAETPLLSTLGTVDISFSSAGLDFVRLLGSGTILYYINSGGGGLIVHNRGSWSNSNYRTITIHEEIKDEAFLAWLKSEATLISGVIDDGSYDEGYSDGLVDGAEKVKTEEARTVLDLELDVSKVSITVPKGYYANTESLNVDPFYDKGYDDGVDRVKTEEARDENNITYSINPAEATVTIAVGSGYYAENASKVIPSDDLEPMTEIFYERGHEHGYNKGYSDGLADGGGGGGNSDTNTVWRFYWNLNEENIPTISVNFSSAGAEYTGFTRNTWEGGALAYITANGYTEIVWSYNSGWYNQANMLITVHDAITDETLLQFLQDNADLISGSGSEVDDMMLLDEYHDWEGEPPFYSYRKWLDYGVSSLSSAPVVVSVDNYNPLKYLHVYVYIEEMSVGDRYETIVLPPANAENEWYSFNSLEIDNPCYSVEIYGIRWSEDGV